MGYSTDFEGVFSLNKPLTDEDANFLRKLNNSRRMKLKAPKEYGVEGEFYVEESSSFGELKDNKIKVLEVNDPPSTQPGLWCQWVPTDDNEGLEWDSGEKAYNMEDWIFYIINRYLAPRGYVLNGLVNAYGEDPGDVWAIKVENNVVRIAHSLGLGKMTEWEKTRWEKDKKIPITVKETKPPKKKANDRVYIRTKTLDGEIYVSKDDLCSCIDSICKLGTNKEISGVLKSFKESVITDLT